MMYTGPDGSGPLALSPQGVPTWRGQRGCCWAHMALDTQLRATPAAAACILEQGVKGGGEPGPRQFSLLVGGPQWGAAKAPRRTKGR